mgnify:FL=1
MNKIYNFTNEFVAAYPKIYNMDGINMLSILGSGDQYFTAILNGAKNVDLIDVNIVSWYYFILKFTAIKYLSYEEFISYFVINKINDITTYLKLREYLPYEARRFFDKLRITKTSFSSIIINSNIETLFDEEKYRKYIPYFDKLEYLKLQEILKNKTLPTFFNYDFKDFVTLNKKISYDLLMLSNIFDWMNLSPTEFKAMLDNVNISVIQALYKWNYSSTALKFQNLGFEVFNVPPVIESEYTKENFVFTLRKTK